jgi:transketolase
MKTLKLVYTAITLLIITQTTIAHTTTNNEDLVLKMAVDEEVKNLLKHANQILFVNLMMNPNSLPLETKTKYDQLTQKCEEKRKRVESKFPQYALASIDEKKEILSLISQKLPMADSWSCAATARGATATCFEISSNFQFPKFLLCIAASGLADLAYLIATSSTALPSIHTELVEEVKSCTSMFYSSDVATVLAMRGCASSWMDAVIGCFIAP